MNTIQRNLFVGLLQCFTLIAACWTALYFSHLPPKAVSRLGIVVTAILLFDVFRQLVTYSAQSRLRRGVEEKKWAPELRVSPRRFIDSRLVTFLIVFVVVFLLTRFV